MKLEGVVYLEDLMIKLHGGVPAWRAYRELYRRHTERREETEGWRHWHKAKTEEDRLDVVAKYGHALERYREKKREESSQLT